MKTTVNLVSTWMQRNPTHGFPGVHGFRYPHGQHQKRRTKTAGLVSELSCLLGLRSHHFPERGASGHVLEDLAASLYCVVVVVVDREGHVSAVQHDHPAEEEVERQVLRVELLDLKH